MPSDSQMQVTGGPAHWTKYLWAASALLLLVPLIAMQFTNEIRWDGPDFLFMATMLAAACAIMELAVRMSGSAAYRLATAVAVLASFLIIWANLAVGIVGSEDNPANDGFFLALLLAIVGSLVARFRAMGMAIVMLITALAVGVALIAAIEQTVDPTQILRWRQIVATLVISSPFLLSAALYRRAAAARVSKKEAEIG